MNKLLFSLLVALPLTGCGKSAGSVPTGKADGPPIETLSGSQLLAAYQDCTRYGQIEDPRVKYTAPYCAAVQSAQLSNGYSDKGTASVDPKLNPMH